MTEPDILYAEAEGRNVIVTLKDGRTVKVATTAINLFSQIENHPTFFAPTVRAILNGRYMEKLGFRKVIMCDGKKFPLHRDCVAYANSFWQSITCNLKVSEEMLSNPRSSHWG